MAAPNILCDTAGMTNAQWLAARMHGPSGKIPYTVGGSDVAAVFGVSPWTTPLELWMIKKGRMKPPAKSNANQLEMGHDKAAMLAKIEGINEVEGFDPTPFAVDYTDLETGEVRKRLPVMIQMAWFRMKYPEGRIAITVSPGKDCFVATAKVYPSYKDGAECYLAEATASRGYLADKPSVSPREWAQTAAVGIALRNAGFGLQFAMAGDEFEDTATDELNGNSAQAGGSTPPKNPAVTPEPETEEEYTVEPTAPPQRELTFEEKVEQAMRVPCPITKYGGKTLGDVLQMDPKAIQWCATKFTGSEEIRNAAKLICEYAQQKASA